MITLAEVEIGTGGTLPCMECARHHAPESVARPADEVRERLIGVRRRWASGPGPNVSFVGFEPFAHPELPIIIRVAADTGYRAIRLRTDAGALSVPANAEGALAAGVRQIEVVLLADEDRHDELTQRRGLFAAAEAGVRVFREAAERAGLTVAITGLVPVCKHNAEHAPFAAARLARWGAVAVHVDASAAREADRPYIVAALDTAAANACAGSVSGLEGEVPFPWSVRPWDTVEAGA